MGNLKSYLIKLFWSFTLILVVGFVFSASVKAQPQWATFDTKGHPKAKGVWMTVRYPEGWEVEEGRRPNIVKKFTYFNSVNKAAIRLMLLIKDLPPEFHDFDFGSLSTEEWQEFGRDILTLSGSFNSKIKSLKKIIHEGQHGVMGALSIEGERAGIKTQSEAEMLVIFYNNKIINLHCHIDDPIETEASIVNTFRSRASEICFQYFNSAILMDRY